MVGGWIASYVFIFISWSRCCCCCCCCLLLLPTLVLKRRDMLGTSIAAVVLGCFYFCPLDCDASVVVVDCAAVETGCMLEKYIKVATKYVFFFIFGSRCSCCCCVLLLLPTTSVLKRREMFGTSIAAVVLGCFYFCPLDCDASVMVVDCAAVDTGCMLEK